MLKTVLKKSFQHLSTKFSTVSTLSTLLVFQAIWTKKRKSNKLSTVSTFQLSTICWKLFKSYMAVTNFQQCFHNVSTFFQLFNSFPPILKPKMSFQLFNIFSTCWMLKTLPLFGLYMDEKKVFNTFNTPYYYYYTNKTFFQKKKFSQFLI